MIYSIKKSHSFKIEQEEGRDSHTSVDRPDNFNRIEYSGYWSTAVDFMAFGIKKNGRSVAAAKTDREEKSQDADAADPLHKGTPEKNRRWHLVKSGEDRQSRSGDTAGRFKESIDKGVIEDEEYGDCTDQGDYQPG